MRTSRRPVRDSGGRPPGKAGGSLFIDLLCVAALFGAALGWLYAGGAFDPEPRAASTFLMGTGWFFALAGVWRLVALVSRRRDRA